MRDNPLIKVNDVEFGYTPDRTVLHIERLEIEKGMFVLVIGPNGSGKSTLCKLLAGALEPPKPIRLPEPRPVLVWQEQELFPLTVERNLKVVCRSVAKINELLESFGLADKRNLDPAQLSGGEREKLAIARALAVEKTQAIILDEPTQSIDPSFVGDVASAILEIHRRGVATVVVTHDERFVSLLSGANPSVYIIQPRLRKARQTNHSEVTGPYELADVFRNPPTLYAAEFAGFENIYKIGNPKKPIEMRNLYPVPEEDLGPNPVFVAIPEDAFSISETPTETTIEAELTSEEYRGREGRVARYRWSVGGGMKPVEYVVRWDKVSSPPQRAYLSLDKTRCIQIKTH